MVFRFETFECTKCNYRCTLEFRETAEEGDKSQDRKSPFEHLKDAKEKGVVCIKDGCGGKMEHRPWEDVEGNSVFPAITADLYEPIFRKPEDAGMKKMEKKTTFYPTKHSGLPYMQKAPGD